MAGTFSIADILDKRAAGTLRPRSFSNHLSHIKSQNMMLLDEMQIVSPHKRGIPALSMDRIEHRFLLSGGFDATLAVFDLSRWGSEEYLKGQTTKPGCVYKPVAQSLRTGRNQSLGHWCSIVEAQWYAFDTGAFVSASTDGALFVWDTETMKPVVRWEPFPSIRCLHLSPSSARSSSLIAVGSLDDGVIKLVDMRSGAASHSLTGHSSMGGITCLQWSPACDVVLASGGGDGTIRLWDIRKSGSRSAITTLDQDNPTTHRRAAHHYSPDGGHLRYSARKVAPNNFRHVEFNVATSHSNAVSGMSFAKDGHFMVSTARDGRLHLWDLRATGHLVPLRFHSPSNQQPVDPGQARVPMLIEQRENIAWVGKGNKALGFNLEKGGKPIQILEGHLGNVTSLERIEDSMKVLSGGSDGMILAWGSGSSSKKRKEQEHSGRSAKRLRQRQFGV